MRLLLPIFLLSIALFSTASQVQATESYIVVERHSRRVLLASGTEFRRPVASLAHMLTAKVAMDWAKAAGVSSTTLINVPSHSFYTGSENPLGLQAGDKLSLRDALYAVILTNDCVASTTLANHVGQNLLSRRQTIGDPLGIFVSEMNNLARASGMQNSRWVLPSGADTQKRSNQATTSDMAKISVKLATDSGFGFYAKQKQRSLRVVKRDGREVRISVVNSNKLLGGSLKVAGLKSGYSPAAGQCFSVVADKNSYVQKLPTGGETVTPVQLIVVVLGSANAETTVKNLIPQAWTQYENWRKSGYMASADRRGFLKLPQAL